MDYTWYLTPPDLVRRGFPWWRSEINLSKLFVKIAIFAFIQP